MLLLLWCFSKPNYKDQIYKGKKIMASINENKFLCKMMGTDPKKPEEMQPKEVLSYSVAGLGQNIICQLVTTFFMIYMTDVAGVSARWLAWMFLGARLFDAFNDPIMGTFVDMTKSKWGKMRPYLKFSPIPIAILTALLFTSFPSWSMGAKFAYSTVIYIAWGIAYTSVDVPYWGLASSMTSDTEKRNTLLTIARLFCTIGSGLVSVLIPIFTDTNPETRTFNIDKNDLLWIYPIIAIISVLIALPTFWIGFKNTKERFYDEKSKASLKKNLSLLVKNKPVLIMILVGVLGGLRTIYMTTAYYYATYNLRNTGLAAVIFLLVVPGGLAATLLTPVLSKKFGKKTIFLWSHIIGGILLVLLYFIGLKSNGTSMAAQIAFYIIIILAGIPSGFSNILTYSMIADSIDYLEDKTGERAEGICFSMQTFISKIGMALTAFVTLMVLGSFGYDEIAVEDLTEEIINSATFQEVVKGNWMATTLLCGLSMFACAIPLFFYTFTEKRQVEAVARVLARKKAAGTMTETEEGEFMNALKAIDPKRTEVFEQILEILGIDDLSELGETFTFTEDAEGNVVEEAVTVDEIEISKNNDVASSDSDENKDDKIN